MPASEAATLETSRSRGGAALVSRARRLAVGVLTRKTALDLVAIAIVLRVGSVFARRLTYSGIGYDERFYVYGGYSVLHGESLTVTFRT